MTDPVQIVTVKQQPSGLWIVTDSEGTKHATKSPFMASLADQYRKRGTRVRIHGASGWYYRQIAAITPLDSLEVTL